MSDAPEDFPAAHSMDTAWFAVDLDGHVAMFETGEAGAVPAVAYASDEAFGLLDELRKEVPRSENVHDLEGHAGGEAGNHVQVYEGRTEYAAVMFFASLEPLRALLEKAGAKEVRASVGAAVVVEKCDRATFEALHGPGGCVGCYFHFEMDGGGAAAHGLYFYEHVTENWVAGPYTRVERPSKPATLAEVPRSVAEHAIKFDGRFAETLVLQPAEHWACDAWGPSWIERDLKTVHPFPGREADYEQERQSMAGEIGRELVFTDRAVEKPRGELATSPRPPPPPEKRPWWKPW